MRPHHLLMPESSRTEKQLKIAELAVGAARQTPPNADPAAIRRAAAKIAVDAAEAAAAGVFAERNGMDGAKAALSVANRFHQQALQSNNAVGRKRLASLAAVSFSVVSIMETKK